jgi:hypothetical protein
VGHAHAGSMDFPRSGGQIRTGTQLAPPVQCDEVLERP